MSNKNIYLWLAACFLIACGIRVFTLLNTEHLNSVTVFRVNEAYQQSVRPFNNPVWLSPMGTGRRHGYDFLNSLLIYYFGHPMMVTRLFSLVFGILTCIPYFLLIRSSFSEKIALASLFAFAIYPIHIQISVVPMANAAFIFWMICAFYFVMKFFDKQTAAGKNIYLAILITFTLLATMFRLEAWGLIFIFGLFFTQERKLKEGLIFLLFSSLYIAYVLYISYKKYKDPFAFLAVPLFNLWQEPISLLATRGDMPKYGKYQIFIWFDTLSYTFSLPLIIAGIFGIFTSLKDKKPRMLLTAFCIFFIILTARQVISNEPAWKRYSALLGVFLIPFISAGIYKTCEYLRRMRNLGKVLAGGFFVISACYFCFISVNILNKEIGYMKFSGRPKEAMEWVKREIKSGDLVISTLHYPFLINGALNKGLAGGSPDKPIEWFENKLTFDRANYLRVVEFVKNYNAPSPPKKLEHVLIRKPGTPRKCRRVLFVLNNKSLDHLKNNFPDLFEKIKIEKMKYANYGILAESD